MTLEEFRDVLVDVLDELPAGLQPYLDRFEFDVADAPSPQHPERRSFEERVELSAGGRFGLAALRRITLYREPFEAAGSRSDVRELVREELIDRITSPPDEDEDEEDEGDGAT